MAGQQLRCPCGHVWDHPLSGTLPADRREICPVCTASIQAASTPADRIHGPASSVSGLPRAELKPGDDLAGFEILRLLNRGGMGIVYKARQIAMDRLVALKVIAPEYQGDADLLKRFQREVRAAASLNHPNIVTVYATELTGPMPYLAMEYVDGIDLHHLVKHSGPLGFLESCAYMRQVALGLHHAFQRGLVHRDIKPGNLMVTPSPFDPAVQIGPGRAPVVKILDMGLARVEARDKGLEEGLTRAGEFVGTPDFAAPEQAEDPRVADIRADLYSLGATWFFLLTGVVPFPGVSLMQKLRRQLTQPTPVVTDHCPEVPPALAYIIRKLMDRDPAQRYQTPAELVEAIASYVRNPSQAMGSAPGVPSLSPPKAEPIVVPAHARGVVALALSGDGNLLLTAGEDETLRLWETPELREVRTVNGDPGPVCGLAMVRSGKWAASCALRLFEEDMVVQLWDLSVGVERRRLPGVRQNLTCVALSPDGRKVAAGSEAGTIHLWTLDPPNFPPLVLEGHVGFVTGLTFVPDGGVLLSVGDDGTLRQWDVKAGRPKGMSQAEAGPLRAVAFDGASKRVAVAGALLRLLQPDGKWMTLEGHQESVLAVTFSNDGSLLASGGTDRTIRLWDSSSGQEFSHAVGHTGPVRAVAFNPESRVIYSASADGTLRRWVF